jgi:hypothetical protein
MCAATFGGQGVGVDRRRRLTAPAAHFFFQATLPHLDAPGAPTTAEAWLSHSLFKPLHILIGAYYAHRS